MALLYLWTRECEIGVSDLKYDRKALSNTAKKFGMAVSKLPTVLARSSWRNVDEPFGTIHRLRIESMITVCMHCPNYLIFSTFCYVGQFFTGDRVA